MMKIITRHYVIHQTLDMYPMFSNILKDMYYVYRILNMSSKSYLCTKDIDNAPKI